MISYRCSPQAPAVPCCCPRGAAGSTSSAHRRDGEVTRKRRLPSALSSLPNTLDGRAVAGRKGGAARS